jgi:PTH1 family peptidyl-tRNA hydrolase|tara:strand:+ start:109 stop:696 length:588 start_codon:yes stop_codon:yes gene_type:complete
LKLVLGIGNPGIKYLKTRHNAGFIILDKIAEKLNLEFIPSKFDFYFARGQINNSEFILVKPTTFVNLSGRAAKNALEHCEVEPKDFLVVTDDINLDDGKIRIRRSGGDGGHNGLSSIIYELMTEDFPRLRYGVGKYEDKGNMADFVLSNYFDDSNEEQLEKLNFASEIVIKFLESSIEGALEYFSRNFNKSIDQS